MYANPNDKIGVEAYKVLRNAIAQDMLLSGTTDISRISEWQAEYKAIAGHNASPACYHSALTDAIWAFEANHRNNTRCANFYNK